MNRLAQAEKWLELARSATGETTVMYLTLAVQELIVELSARRASSEIDSAAALDAATLAVSKDYARAQAVLESHGLGTLTTVPARPVSSALEDLIARLKAAQAQLAQPKPPALAYYVAHRHERGEGSTILGVGPTGASLAPVYRAEREKPSFRGCDVIEIAGPFEVKP